MRKNEKTTIPVDIKHLFEFDANYDLREAIISEYGRLKYCFKFQILTILK